MKQSRIGLNLISIQQNTKQKNYWPEIEVSKEYLNLEEYLQEEKNCKKEKCDNSLIFSNFYSFNNASSDSTNLIGIKIFSKIIGKKSKIFLDNNQNNKFFIKKKENIIFQKLSNV